MELPKVFANKIDEKIGNNNEFVYEKLSQVASFKDEKKVLEKIDELIHNDRNNVECTIKFENEEKSYTIIGKTNNHLVTKEQRLIPIKDIYDISIK